MTKRLVATGSGWKVTVDLALIVRLNAEIEALRAEVEDLKSQLKWGECGKNGD